MRQGGTHTGIFAWPGLEAVPATGRVVTIPEHFFYRVRGDLLVEIRPEPYPVGRRGESWSRLDAMRIASPQAGSKPSTSASPAHQRAVRRVMVHGSVLHAPGPESECRGPESSGNPDRTGNGARVYRAPVDHAGRAAERNVERPARNTDVGLRSVEVNRLITTVPAIEKVVPVRESPMWVSGPEGLIDARIVGTTRDYAERAVFG